MRKARANMKTDKRLQKAGPKVRSILGPSECCNGLPNRAGQKVEDSACRLCQKKGVWGLRLRVN